MYTKKDFIDAAKIVSQVINKKERLTVAFCFSIFFENKSSTFNKYKFLKACNTDENEE
jgi:hypothetical protein